VSGVVDQTASVRHRPHQTERVDVSTAVVLDRPQLTVDARELVRLVDSRVTTQLITLGYNTALLIRRMTRLILLHTFVYDRVYKQQEAKLSL